MFLLNRDIFLWDLTILLLLVGTLSMFVAAVCWMHATQTRKTYQRLIVGFVGIFGLLGFMTVVYGSFVEPKLITRSTYSVSFPVRKPLKVAVISDFHLGPYKDAAFLQKVVQEINNALPDVVILGGDYFFTAYADISAIEPISRIRAPLGVFAALGNHDMGHSLAMAGFGWEQKSRAPDLRTAFKRMNITVLENSNTLIRTSAGDFSIAGVGDIWSRNTDVGKALEGTTREHPIILIAHSPDIMLDARSLQAQLIITGHTHGGQIRLPFIGPIAPIPTRVGQTFDQGLFHLDNDTTLAITRGIGESSPRARLFAPPEVMILELAAGPDVEMN